MKWISAVLVFLFFSPVILGAELLTLTSPQNGMLDEERQNSIIVWSDDDEKWLQSWRLSCMVVLGILNQTGDNKLFYSRGISSNGAEVADDKKGVIVGITEEGKLYAQCNGVREVLVGGFTLSQNKIYKLSIEFQTWFSCNEDRIVNGSLYVTLDDDALEMHIDTVDKIDYCFLKNKNVYSDTAYPMLRTDLKHSFSNIELYKLDNRIIPEPSTVVLLSMSLSVLAFRRRRR